MPLLRPQSTVSGTSMRCKILNFMRLLLLLFSWLPISAIAQHPNSVSTAATKFINSLDSSQKVKSIFEFEEMSRYEWHFLPGSMTTRQGISIKDIDTIQKENFYILLKYFLSERGYDRTKEIMTYEYLLQELEPNNRHRIPENYFVAIYGHPNQDSIWGWKFSGHHLALNFTIVNNKIAFAPFFFGISPAIVKGSNIKEKRIIKDEEDLAFKLINSLSKLQKQKTIFQLKAFTEIVTTNAQQVAPLTSVGLTAREMTYEQKSILNQLLVAYLSSMPKQIASARMKRIATEDMEVIRFGWAGGLIPGEPHYYRIQGKTFLIEFDNTQDNANHIHSVWRDFNGDFGSDLLKEHYQNSKHHHK